MSDTNAVTSMIYSGGPLYSKPTVIDKIKKSGITTVVAWAVHVQSNADLVFNNPPIIQLENNNFKYVGDASWPERLASLKQGNTSVNQILFSIGGWDVQDFSNIKNLIDEHGISENSPLYKSFKALKEAIPAIDGIDLDDETLYDDSSTKLFCQMLHGLGYEVTFCPYTKMDYWIDKLLCPLNTATPGLVNGFNLQCYSGGAGNDPKSWIKAIKNKMGKSFSASSFVYPGLWSRHGDNCSEGDDPSQFEEQFANWRPDGIRGGFIWLYDDILKCNKHGDLATYSQAIENGLGNNVGKTDKCSRIS